MFKRGRDDTQNVQVQLPDERKALVERYMIDAEEAAARAQIAASQQAEQAERHEPSTLPPAPEVKRETRAAPAVAPAVPKRPTPENLPVYGWLDRVVPTPPAAADWPRELVKAQEARSQAARSA